MYVPSRLLLILEKNQTIRSVPLVMNPVAFITRVPITFPPITPPCLTGAEGTGNVGLSIRPPLVLVPLKNGTRGVLLKIPLILNFEICTISQYRDAGQSSFKRSRSQIRKHISNNVMTMPCKSRRSPHVS